MKQLLNFLEMVIKSRMDHELGKTETLVKPNLDLFFDQNNYLGKMIKALDIKNQELLLLSLAMVPYINPGFLSKMVQEYFPDGTSLPEFGGYKTKYHRGIIPTGETLMYLLAGTDPVSRKKYFSIFRDSTLLKKGHIILGEALEEEPFFAAPLYPDPEFADKILMESIRPPKPSPNFPAERIQTDLEWNDLVLSEKTLTQIRALEDWLTYNDQLMEEWGLKKSVKPGYRVMFFGPPGTGKTLAAGLLGKHTGKEVYRVDLSLVVSKYIGETEKNLSRLFLKASGKGWILFFDEADALFGKRTNLKDAKDKHSNQEVAYLLQRIEAYPEMVILASNYKSNLDTAFIRRFQTIIDFEPPGVTERLALWRQYLPKNIQLENKIVLEDLARKYQLTGANIVNIIQQLGLKTLAGKQNQINEDLLIQCIRYEIQKEGKIH
ncbi:MAG: ATP-binding protein [Cytophagales bacterium]|uniref:ATP-binding protein n=1 Tax=Cyclobacterium marinum TaxID=104 RepID=UPI0030DD3024|nr:ATP-binding protein [Cytophagales bacterium]|tara:strand:+ start:241918 stop:243222 length:1305 start_codon:yes stop_codon:yes gene_type:complete